MPKRTTAAANISPSQPYQSLGAGIDVLLALAMSNEPVGSRPLARKLGLEATKVNRLLGTLASLGLASKTEDRRYVIGPGVHVLAAMSLRGSRLFSAALPVLEELQSKTGRLVALGVLWRREVCYLFHSPADQPVEASVAARDLYPAEHSSIGLALLAERPEGHWENLFDASELKEVETHVTDNRRRGYALSPDGVSMAVAVGSPAVAAVAVANEKRKLTAAQQKKFFKILQEAAEEISAAI